MLPQYLTPGGHRRYSLQSLKEFSGSKVSSGSHGFAIGYGRVSSHDQLPDLERQTQRLSEHLESKGHTNILMVKDQGSGLNYKKPGLQKLLRLITSGQVRLLVLTHKDRLLRFGSELIFTLCKNLGIEVQILSEKESIEDSFEVQLSKDVLEIVTVFSARLYGRRAHENRRRVAAA